MKVFIRTNDKTTTITYKPEKRTNQITSRGVLEDKGVCRVSYSSAEFNEFEFDGKEDFVKKFLPCVEKDLLRFLGVK